MFFKGRVFLTSLVTLFCSSLIACQATPTLAPASEAGISVAITGNSCPNVSVKAGQQISWTNQDRREHIVQDTTDAEHSQFDSGPLQRGDHFEFTFANTGTFTYTCTEDGSMTGTITVDP